MDESTELQKPVIRVDRTESTPNLPRNDSREEFRSDSRADESRNVIEYSHSASYSSHSDSHSGTFYGKSENRTIASQSGMFFGKSERPGERSVRFSEKNQRRSDKPINETTPLIYSSRAQHPLSQSVLFKQMASGRIDSASNFMYSRSIILSGAGVTRPLKKVMESRTLSLPDKPSDDRLASTASTYCNSMCMIIGLGIYTMPSLASTGGISVLALVLLLGFLSWYTSRLLLTCQQQQSRSQVNVTKRVYENMVEVGRATIQPYGDVMMQVLIMSSALADIYTLIFCAQVTIDLLDKYVQLSKPLWIVIWGLVSIPTYFIRRMSALAWFGIIAMMIYSAVILSSFTLLCLQPKVWGYVEVSNVFNFETVCIAYGVIANSYCLHLAVPAIEASMKHAKHASPMFDGLFASNILIKFFFAGVGVLAYGNDCRETVTTNFAIGDYPGVARFVNVGMAVYLFFELPLIMFVVFETVDLSFLPRFHLFNQSKVGNWCWIVLSRVTISILLVFIGVCVPKLKYVISLIGTIRGTVISFLLPIYFHTKLKRRHLSRFRIGFHILLMFLTAVAGCAGFWYAMKGLIFY